MEITNLKPQEFNLVFLKDKGGRTTRDGGEAECTEMEDKPNVKFVDMGKN